MPVGSVAVRVSAFDFGPMFVAFFVEDPVPRTQIFDNLMWFALERPAFGP